MRLSYSNSRTTALHVLYNLLTSYTGKERDTESGLDYFGARYYGSSMGRFMGPDYSDDPDPVPFADLSNPQSLNLYGYVQNNPLSNTDPNGHVRCPDGTDAMNLFGADAQAVLGGALNLTQYQTEQMRIHRLPRLLRHYF